MDCIVQVLWLLLLLMMWRDAEIQSVNICQKYIYIRWNDDPNIRRINRSICWNMKIVFGGNLSIRLSKFQLTWSGWRSSLRQERSWSSNVCFFVWESGELQGKLCVLQHWNDSYTQGQMSCGRWKCRWMAQARWENSENGSWIGG